MIFNGESGGGWVSRRELSIKRRLKDYRTIVRGDLRILQSLGGGGEIR